MAYKIFHAVITAVVFASSALTLPVDPTDPPRVYGGVVMPQPYAEAVIPQLHTVDLDNMNLTAIPARLPSLENSQRHLVSGLDPSQAVGLIKYCNAHECMNAGTASLVGPRHIITARHVGAGFDGMNLTRIFFPDYNHGKFSGKATIEHMYAMEKGTMGPCEVKNESAVMILSERLGDSFGSFGVRVPDAEYLDKPIFSHRSYSLDDDHGENPLTESGISLSSHLYNNTVPQFDCDGTSGPLYTDFQGHHGQSGSALWDEEKKVWGVLSAATLEGDPRTFTTWASGDVMLAAVNQALEEFP